MSMHVYDMGHLTYNINMDLFRFPRFALYLQVSSIELLKKSQIIGGGCFSFIQFYLE